MLKPMKWVAALIAGTTLCVPAVADVTMSSSNNPTVTLNHRLGSLFGAETNALAAFGA